MKHNYNLNGTLRTVRLLAFVQLSVLIPALSAEAAAQTVVQVAPFRSVEMHDGIHAILRHGPTQQVTLLKGSTDYTTFTVTDGNRLVIDKCKSRCPRGYAVEIEIITADIAGIVVSDGGRIQSRGSFPFQQEIEVAVRQGGMIDVRSMMPYRINASVEQGGVILTMPQTILSAKIMNGGRIIYWGDPRVESSVRQGGVVVKGTAEELDKAHSEMNLEVPPLPALPSVRPIEPLQNPPRHRRN